MNYNALKLFKIRNGVFYVTTLFGVMLSVMESNGQISLPAPRQIPFFEDFSNTISGAYLTNASILVARGFTSGAPPLAPAQTTKSGAEATLDGAFAARALGTGLLAPLSNTVGSGTRSNGSNPASYLNITDAGLLISLNNRSWAVVSGIKTTGFQNVKLSYTLALTERAANNLTPNLNLVVFAQYKLNAADSWKTILGSDWSTTGINVNDISTFTGLTLPTEVENRNEVYIRFVHYQTADVTVSDLLSYAIDNISVTGDAFTLSNLDISVPSAPAEGVPFDVVVKATNAAGTVGTVTGNTAVTLSGVGTTGVLAGNLSTTILSGMSSATFSGLTFSQASALTLTGTVVSGDALAADMAVVTVAALPTKYKIERVVPQAGTVFFANQPISVVISSYNTLDLLSPVPNNSIFTLTGTDLAGITTGTITSGMNQTTVTGVLIPSTASGYTISVSSMSGSNLASATSSAFDVKLYPTILSISTLSGIARKSPFTILVNTKNIADEIYNLNTALGLTLSVASGTGTLNTTSATISVGTSSITITGVTYDKTESGVSISVSGAGFVGAVTNVFTVSGPAIPTEGFTIPLAQSLPYLQDFGTNISIWNDVTASSSILPFGLVVARQTPTPFRTFDDADLSNYLATGFVGGSSVNPVTYAGGNIGLRIETRENRGEALVLALKSSGYENLKLSYTLVPEVITGAGVYGMVAQARIGSSGFFSNIVGTEYVSTAPGVVLGTPINYNVTLPSALSGQSVVNIRWVRWHNNVDNSVILDNISISGTKTNYLSITGINPSKIFVGDASSIIVSAFDKFNMPQTVTSATVISITGNTSLLGTTTATILAGSSSATISGLLFATSKYQASLNAFVVSGDAFGAASSNLFNVSGVPTLFKVIDIQPLGAKQIGKPVSVKIKLVDAFGKTALAKTNTNVVVSVSGGTGILVGTTTGTFTAMMDSIITIKTFTYSKAESNLKLAINGGGFAEVLSDTISFKADAFAGISVLYSEDFEKSVKPSVGFPSIPSEMKMFSIDGQTAITATYPSYGTDAWVIRRVPQEGFLGRGGDVQPTPTYWSNVNSAAPDSNYIAYSASWFNDNTKAADRWLVTPGISMVGGNFKLNYQAKSSTSSGNFKDRLEVKVTTQFNGTSIISNDWETISVKNLSTGLDSLSHLVSTRVINFEYAFNDAFVKNQVIYLAFRLVTPADKGDRISVDNIYVTSGGATSIKSSEISTIGLKAMPNPAYETIVIQSAILEEVKIYNLIGNEVLTAKTNSIISIGSLTKGLYIAVTKNGSIKFVVE